MPGKRATKPLFDLLQQGRARAVESRLPDPQSLSPDSGARSNREPRGAGFAEAPIRIVGGVMQMPLVYAAVGLAVSLAAVLFAWAAGYHRGEAAAKSQQRLLESALGPGMRVVEPGGEGTGTESPVGQVPSNPAGGGANPANNQTKPARSVAGEASFVTPAGPTEDDPRRDRHNYLQLGSSIRPAEVASAIEFLGSRGLECFGVIESRAGRGNDGPLYVLFAGLGFPSGEAGSPEAQRYRDQIVAAGAGWKAAGGVRSFDDAGWVLYRR